MATHTHSGPALSPESTDTAGIRNADWQEYWKRSILKVAVEAFFNEEEIGDVEAGKAPLELPVGRNRVDPETNITDPAIRWLRFHRPDGSVKLLIHNYAAHGVADNGPLYKMASSDWMGAANRIIRERHLADYALFLQGAAGDQNTRISCLITKRESAGRELAAEYVSYLERDMPNGTSVDPSKIFFRLKCFEVPTVEQTAEQLRHDAEAYFARGRDEAEKAYWTINGTRLQEMAILAGKKYPLGCSHDLQIIRLGETEFFFVPGELFIEPGIELLEGADSKFPFISTLSNGDGAYLFTEKVARQYPSAFTESQKSYGYYEIYGYMHQLRYKYQDNIASFIINSFRTMEEE